MNFLHLHNHVQPEAAAPKLETEVKPVVTAAVAIGGTAAVPAKETLGEKIVDVEKKVITLLDFVGTEAERGLVFAVRYAVPLDSLIGFLIPGLKPEADAGVVVLNLIQATVLEVKAKSASLPTNLTPAQMLADEIALVGPAVIYILAKEGVKMDTAKLGDIIKAVVGILNVVPVAA